MCFQLVVLCVMAALFQGPSDQVPTDHLTKMFQQCMIVIVFVLNFMALNKDQ